MEPLSQMRTVKVLGVALLVSIFANGLFAGNYLKDLSSSPQSRSPNGGLQMPGGDFSLQRLPSALTGKQRRAFNKSISPKDRRAMRRSVEEMNDARADLGGLIRDPEATLEQLKAAMTQSRQRRQRVAKQNDEAISNYLSTLSLQERLAVFANMRVMHSNRRSSGQRRSGVSRPKRSGEPSTDGATPSSPEHKKTPEP